MDNNDYKENKADDRFNALTAVVLILALVGGVVYWLSGMPS
ncbi:MAG: hypothetical protein AB7I18_08360 [Candidatus Berkiella sp.]